MARVLLLGAGRVSRPIVRYFLDETREEIVVASLYVEDAERLIDGHPRGTAAALDVADEASLVSRIRDADVAVSLVPYALHPRIARLCIEHRVPLVTASYVSPEMQALDAEARARGVLLLNEMGFDPGLDHMSAAHLIRRARDRGARITRFVSCAGGLPHPDCADNPWKYRFSWSPRGVLLAGLADARYLADGHVVERPSPQPFAHPFPYPVHGVGTFEMYPNRDSVKYLDVYGLEHARDMLRGTLRYPGWCETMRALVALGLLDDAPRVWDGRTTFADWARSRTGRPAATDARGAREAAAAKLGLAPGAAPLERLAWAGLFDEEPVPPARPRRSTASRTGWPRAWRTVRTSATASCCGTRSSARPRTARGDATSRCW